MDPTHRRRRARRGRSHFDPARRFGRRHHRYDPIFGGPGSWRDVASDYGLVALGSILHNYVVHKLGYGANVRSAGPINATDAGLAAGAVGIVGQKMGYIPGWLGKVFQGMFSEGLNYPAAEQMQRTGPNQAGGSDSGAYGNTTPGNAIASRSAAAQGPIDYSYLTAWGYT